VGTAIDRPATFFAILSHMQPSRVPPVSPWAIMKRNSHYTAALRKDTAVRWKCYQIFLNTQCYCWTYTI